MAFVRKNVWELGAVAGWPDEILWYARGVEKMQSRALSDPTSWKFFAAIHGINPAVWESVNRPVTSAEMPSPQVQQTYWRQCQHGTWYFLPWHRGYLLALEATVRAAIISLGGPSNWSLPYWNYFKDNQSALPSWFASEGWPYGAKNPLYVKERFGPQNDGNVHVDLRAVDLNAMRLYNFIGGAFGGSAGFGGVVTGFMQYGNVHGGIESQPHDAAHGLIGGRRGNVPGVMSNPNSAALDPIFYLHHANIDRLWEAWMQSSNRRTNPTDLRWLDGPASTGERAFAMPRPDGSSWQFTPREMIDLAPLNYSYDNVSPGITVPSAAERLATLGLETIPLAGVEAMSAREEDVELVGASESKIELRGTGTKASVRLDTATAEKLSDSFIRPLSASHRAPDRVFLNLENVRGRLDSVVFAVYVGPADQADLTNNPQALAGSIGLFGVSQASDPDEHHGGAGITYVLEITDIVDRLQLQHSLNVESLNVQLAPVSDVPEEAEVSIGRISIYRQGP